MWTLFCCHSWHQSACRLNKDKRIPCYRRENTGGDVRKIFWNTSCIQKSIQTGFVLQMEPIWFYKQKIFMLLHSGTWNRVTLGKVKTKMKEKSTKHVRNTVRALQNALKDIFPNQEESLDNTRFGLVQCTTILWNTHLWDH